jgi:hypothetical protein
VRTGLPIKIDILTSVLIFPDDLYSSSTALFRQGRRKRSCGETFPRRRFDVGHPNGTDRCQANPKRAGLLVGFTPFAPYGVTLAGVGPH